MKQIYVLPLTTNEEDPKNTDIPFLEKHSI